MVVVRNVTGFEPAVSLSKMILGIKAAESDSAPSEFPLGARAQEDEKTDGSNKI